MSSSISRRSLAKGAAWSVPVIAAAGTVPAMAAASDACVPVMTPNDTLFFDWGSFTTGGVQTLRYSTGLRITGLPRGVQIVKVTMTRWIQQREDSQAYPGIPWPGNSNSSTTRSCSASGCQISYTPLNAGWEPYFTVSPKNQSHTDSNGNSFRGWSLTTTFDGTVQGAGTRTRTDDGCLTATTRPSGASAQNAPLVATFTNNPRTGNSNQGRLRALTEEIITVQLSNGQTLTQRNPSVIAYDSNG